MGTVDSSCNNERTKASLSSSDLKDSWLLRQLLSSYQNCPSFIKIGGLDFSFTFASFFSLSAIRFLFFHLLLYLGWPVRTKMTTDAACSLASIIHAVALCSWLAILFAKLGWKNYIPSCKLSDHKAKDFQDASTACLQVCTGYMMFDSFWLVKDTYDLGLQPLTEFDYMVIAHHFMTSLYMTSCRVIQAGHISAMILMLTGEFSNPLMNAFFTTRFAIQLECCNSDSMMLLHLLLEHIFAVVYIALRISIGPACAIHLSWDLLFTKQGRSNVPLPLSMIWVVLVTCVLLGSGPFVIDAVNMLKDGWDLKYPPTFDFGERYAIQGEEL